MIRSRRVILWLVLLGCFLALVPQGEAHPFDGDGAGPAAEGSSNLRLYLYLEPPIARVECLVWMPTALTLCGLPQGTEMVMPPSAQRAVVSAGKSLAPGWCVLRVNGEVVRPERADVTTLKGMPGRSEQLVMGEPVAVMEAMLGLTWTFQMPAVVDKVELEWRGFGGEVQAVPVTVLYGPMVEVGMTLTKEAPVSSWENKGRLAEPPPLAPVPSAQGRVTPRLPWSLLAPSMVGIFLLGWSLASRKHRYRRLALSVATFTLMMGLSLWLVPPEWVLRVGSQLPPPTPAEAEDIVTPLLRNTYRAFEQGSESAIYDVLARSVDGVLLEKLYVQTVRSLAVESMEGTRVKVTDLAATVEKVVAYKDGFVAEGTWTALGVVGHWGHMHQRVNRYKARLTLSPVGSAWKLTGLEVLEEVRS